MAVFEQKIVKNADFPFEIFIAQNSVNDFLVEEHWHDCFEILYQISGSATHIINNQKIHVNSGDIIFIKSGDIHGTIYNKKILSSIFTVKFMPNIIENYSYFSNSKYMAAFLNSDSKHIINLIGDIKSNTEKIMEKLLLEYERKEDGFELFVSSYILELIGLFIREKIIAIPHIEDYSVLENFTKITNFIEKYYNQNIELSDISKMLNMNYSYTSRYFKKITGKTFKQYLDYIRIGEADKMICTSNKSLAEIACECGFGYQQSFSRTYKRVRGYTAKVKKS